MTFHSEILLKKIKTSCLYQKKFPFILCLLSIADFFADKQANKKVCHVRFLRDEPL